VNRILERSAVILFGLSIGGTRALSFDASVPKSNGAVLSDLCLQTVNHFCDDAKIPDTSTIRLTIEEGDANRFLAGTLAQGFRQRFTGVYSGNGIADLGVVSSVASAGIVYGEPFSDGLFSARQCCRTVTLAMRFVVTRYVDGKILWAGTQNAEYNDTVKVSDMEDLQKGSEKIIHGEIPAGSILEQFLEPFIIGGAAGVAVYLFFTIRS